MWNGVAAVPMHLCDRREVEVILGAHWAMPINVSNREQKDAENGPFIYFGKNLFCFTPIESLWPSVVSLLESLTPSTDHL